MAPDRLASVRVRPTRLLACLTLACLLASPALASDFRTIIVDDRFDDWGSAAPAHSDPSDDQSNAPLDLGNVWIANDDRFVYLRFEIGVLANLQSLPAPLDIHIDADDNPATGFPVAGIGSEILIQCTPGGGSGFSIYEQTASAERSAAIGIAPFDAYMGPTAADTEFEIRLKRGTRLPSSGRQVFMSSPFRVCLVAFNASRQPVERSPNTAGGIRYTMATGTPQPRPDNDTRKRDPRHIRVVSYNVLFNGVFDSGRSPRFTRILRALEPDVIGFQEMWDISALQVLQRLNQDLPLANGSWTAIKHDRGTITASRFPTTRDMRAPSGELMVHVDLPDADYATDLYFINSHLKCCGALGTSEDNRRQRSADQIVAWIRELKTRGGNELPMNTPIVHVGDFNLVGGRQPLETLLTGDILNPNMQPDWPPDWDGSAFSYAAPMHSDGFARYTWRSNSSAFAPGKLDFILYSDSVVEPGNGFVLNTLDMTDAKLASLGLEIDDTLEASDHMPVVQDFAVALNSTPTAAVIQQPITRIEARPNPVGFHTLLYYELAAEGQVTIRLYDGNGRMIRDLGAREKSDGPQIEFWNGKNDRGENAPIGVYWARFEHRSGASGTRERTIKLVKIR